MEKVENTQDRITLQKHEIFTFTVCAGFASLLIRRAVPLPLHLLLGRYPANDGAEEVALIIARCQSIL